MKIEEAMIESIEKYQIRGFTFKGDSYIYCKYRDSFVAHPGEWGEHLFEEKHSKKYFKSDEFEPLNLGDENEDES